MIRDTAQAYAADKLAPRVIEAFNDEITDPEIFREMGALGLLGPTIPADYGGVGAGYVRSEEHTSELQSLMRISYAVFCLKKKKNKRTIEKLKSQRHVTKNSIITHVVSV